ncbi:glycine cleavage system protein R [Agilicoccus flavus]|uniref:glycine cleavage system protein R n=1 Tax=Agilicoccus flavus TaxID=2775968 RepID=UPI001CF69F43|nr:ACT domain-containing protein [Agilicoccus flavus]
MARLVLTVIGDDRAGLVHALAEVVSSHGGNWEDSRMAHLGGTFAGLVEVGVADGRTEDLLHGLRSLAGVLDVSARRAGAPAAGPDRVSLRLDLLGNDRPGIVREISQALSAGDVNVVSLTTDSSDAPMSGGRIFAATALLEAPAGADLDAVRDDLEALARDLMVDVTLAETAP